MNYVDPLGLMSDGHHYVPKEIFGKLGLSKEASEIFKRSTTGGPIPGGHYYDGAHRNYNKAVGELMQDWFGKNGIEPSKMTREQAAEFLDVLSRPKDPRIREFLNHIGQKLGRSLVKKSGGFLCRKIPLVAPFLFLYDWRQGGFGHAFNEFSWPASDLWSEDCIFCQLSE